MTPSGIEPATFRFVAQYLNRCATPVPHLIIGLKSNMLPSLTPLHQMHYYCGASLTFWRRNYFFNFSTPCILNVNNTGTKCVRFMKQTVF